jgi:hypothetical protein
MSEYLFHVHACFVCRPSLHTTCQMRTSFRRSNSRRARRAEQRGLKVMKTCAQRPFISSRRDLPPCIDGCGRTVCVCNLESGWTFWRACFRSLEHGLDCAVAYCRERRWRSASRANNGRRKKHMTQARIDSADVKTLAWQKAHPRKPQFTVAFATQDVRVCCSDNRKGGREQPATSPLKRAPSHDITTTGLEACCLP